MSISFLNLTGPGDDYVQGTATLVDPAFTINCWLYPILVTGQIQAATLHNTTNNNRFSIGVSSTTGKAIFQCFDTTIATASTTTNYTANAWNMVTGVASATNSRTVYLNSGGAGTNTTSKTLTTPTRWLLGGTYTGGAIVPTFEGYVAEFAVWSVALLTDEITSLNRGAKASQIRPASLKVYFPGIRNYTDMKETTTAVTTAGTNLSIVPHSRRYG